MTYIASVTVPGYMPETESPEFETISEAWNYLYEFRLMDQEALLEAGKDVEADVLEQIREARESGLHIGSVFANNYSGAEHDLGAVYSVLYSEGE